MEFTRLNLIIGESNLEKIKNTKVLVVGLGGVGGYVVEALARCGVGTIYLVDYDKIDITNINRQLIALHSNIGNKKTDEFEKRIKEINSECKVKKYDLFYDESNKDYIFSEPIDYVVDACDAVKSKELLIKECTKRNIKIICSMGAGNKLDPSKVELTTIDKTSYDPLAKIIRKWLKDERINKKIPCVYSREKLPIRNIKPVGSSAFVPATFGLFMASYIINDIIK